MPQTAFPQLRVIASIAIGAALCNLPVSSLAADGNSPARDVAQVLQPFVDSQTLAGAVTLVASKDKTLSLEAVGWADIGAKKPMRSDNLFWIASMSKPMTATALMMLVDEGKIKVDDPVEKYLPEFRGQMLAVERDNEHQLLKRPARPIQVRDVLSHTSGLPYMSRVEQKIDTFPLRESVLSYALSPLEFQPGTKYAYSNAGINTAGRIIEVVSGMPYETFMRQRLFDPLGMKDTTFWPTAEQLARLAKSYRPAADHNAPDRVGLSEIEISQLTYPLTDHQRGPCPAGGLFSTAADVGVFCRMILNGGALDGRRYVSENSVRQMTSTQTGDLLNRGNGEGGYGFGWETSRKQPAIGPFGHGGAYSTHIGIDPNRGLITIFMVQHAGFPHDAGGQVRGAFEAAAVAAFAK